MKEGNLSRDIARVKLAHIPLNKRKFMAMSASRRKMYVNLLQVAMETSMVNCGLSKPWYRSHKPPTQIFIYFRTRRGCDVSAVAWLPFLKAMFESRLLKPKHIVLVQAYEIESRDNTTEIIISAEASLQKAVDMGKGILLDEMKTLCQKEEPKK